MRVKRTFLYWGAFFIAMGAVMLAASLDGLSDTLLRDALRLWPLVFVVTGIGLLLRATRLSWAGGMLAAAMPGMVLGGVIVTAPRLAAICDGGLAAPLTSRQGTFSGPARVDIALRCGEVEVGTGGGTGWQVDAANTAGWSATVEEAPDRLSVTSARGGWFGGRHGRDAWRLTLPTGTPMDVTVDVDAGAGRFALGGAELGRLSVSADAADAHVDLTGATVDRIAVDLNAGALGLTLAATDDLEGSLSVDAGALRICAPPDLGLRIRSDATLASVHYPGLVPSGDTWESPDYATARHHAQLTVEANVGSVDLNPTGGCQ